MPAYYPVFLDLRNRRCVVLGGGDIGEEKIIRLMEFGARITVISPEINHTLKKIVDGSRLTWIKRQYQPGDLRKAFIAILVNTSNADMNKTVSDEARERNVPLNVVDVTDMCTWIAPAIVRRGDVVLAASTGGSSPALARKFREELSGSHPFPSRHKVMDLAELAPLLSEVRRELLNDGVKLPPDHWQACITDELVDLVLEGKTPIAKDILWSDLIKGVDCGCADEKCLMWESLKNQSEQVPNV